MIEKGLKHYNSKLYAHNTVDDSEGQRSRGFEALEYPTQQEKRIRYIQGVLQLRIQPKNLRLLFLLI